MRDSLDLAVPLVAHFEGFSSRAYTDPVGVWTIGYGETEPAIISKYRASGISESAARLLLRHRLGEFRKGVDAHVRVPLAPQQLAALTSFAYNAGLGAFAESTLLRRLNRGEYDAVDDELMRWTKAGGRVFEGLVLRRKAEGKLFRSWVRDLSPLTEWERESVRRLDRLREAKQHVPNDLLAAIVRRRKALYLVWKENPELRVWVRWRLLRSRTT